MLKQTGPAKTVTSAPQIAIVPPPDTAATAPAWSFDDGSGGNDSFESFKSERPALTLGLPRTHVRTVGLAVIIVALGAPAGWFSWQAWTSRRAVAVAAARPVAPTGVGIFNSVPDGASITIDGVERGITPIRVTLAPGAYTVQIVSGSSTRTLPITIEAGSVSSHYVEFAATPTQQGRLEIGSDPVGSEVRIDGVLKGITPLTVNDVAPGQHRVTISSGGNVINRVVNVVRGATATVVVSMNPAPVAAASGGWLTVEAPLEMEIFEEGRLLGSTRTDRLMLPVGSHRLEFSNASLEFTTARTVQISAGRTTNTVVEVPNGRLSVNALPWANVSIDGSAVGTTPLGELAVTVGQHEVVFRHPQLGERRQNVIVKAQTPTRIGIDLRK
jgi:hypothetical protein